MGTVRVSVNLRSSSSLFWCILRQWRLMLRRELKSWPHRQQEIVTSSTWQQGESREEREIDWPQSTTLRGESLTFTAFFLLQCPGTHPASGALVFRLRLLFFSFLLRLPSPLALVLSCAAVALWCTSLVRLVAVCSFHWFFFPCYRTLSGTVMDIET